MERESLASRVIEMGPSGTSFKVPVLLEIPHFASVRGGERELIVLRCDDGETWREHTTSYLQTGWQVINFEYPIEGAILLSLRL